MGRRKKHAEAAEQAAPPRRALPPLPPAAGGSGSRAARRHAVDDGTGDAAAESSASELAARVATARRHGEAAIADDDAAASSMDGRDVADVGRASQAGRSHTPGVRQLAGAGYTPAGVRRKERRAAEAAVEQIRKDAARAEKDAARAAAEAEKAERASAQFLPRSGDLGPDQLHTYRRLKLQAHRATSEVLAGAYPFLAEAGVGEKGVYVGTDSYSGAAFCFDPWQLYAERVVTNPNVLLAGVIGSGKSSLAKSLAVRSIAFGRKVYVPGDPKGEWTTVAQQVGGQAIQLGGGLPTRLNPLDEGPRPAALDELEWRTAVTSRRRNLLRAMVEMSLGRPLHSTESTAVFAALDAAVAGNSVPTLPHVVAAMWEPPVDAAGSTVEQLRADGREAAHALNRLVGGDLAGLFDGPSTARFDPALPMVSLDLSRIQGSDQLIALVMTCASTWMEAAIMDPDGGRRWIVYDEAWKLLHSPALLARMQSQWKLSRAWGIANMMVIHRLSDLDAVGAADSEARNLALGLLADCSTKIIYSQEAGEDAKTGRMIGLSGAEITQLPDLRLGEGLWKIKDRAFMVQNVLTSAELDLFDTNARMVSG